MLQNRLFYCNGSVEGQDEDTVLYVFSDCDSTQLGENDDYNCDFNIYESYLSIDVSAGDVLFIWWPAWNSITAFNWSLSVTDCSVSTEIESWDAVKSLYR